MRLNFTMNMAWEGLTRLSLSKKTTEKLISRHMGGWLLLIESVHCGSSSILKVRFFGHPVVLKTLLLKAQYLFFWENRPLWDSPTVSLHQLPSKRTLRCRSLTLKWSICAFVFLYFHPLLTHANHPCRLFVLF